MDFLSVDPVLGLCYCNISVSLGIKVKYLITITIRETLLIRIMDKYIRLFHFSRSATISSLQFGQGGVFWVQLMGQIS